MTEVATSPRISCHATKFCSSVANVPLSEQISDAALLAIAVSRQHTVPLKFKALPLTFVLKHDWHMLSEYSHTCILKSIPPGFLLFRIIWCLSQSLVHAGQVFYY